MKFCKKKMAILASVCAFLVVMVFFLCSFTPPSYPSTSTYLDASSLSSIDSENIFSIIYFQDFLGSLNSFQPVACYVSNFYCILILVTSVQSYTGAFVNDIFSVTHTGSWYFTAYLTSGGFSFIQRTSSNINIPSSDLICYSLNTSDSLHYNSSFVPSSSSSNGRDDISDIYDYWFDFYENVQIGESELVSAYDSGYFDGLESGLVWGEELGYQEGYTEGYQEGIGTGYMHGYQAGEAAGYDTGYDDGYQDGYETGYDSGYAEAERETVIEYVEPIELDIPRIFNSVTSIPNNILQGSFDFDFFGINLYGLLRIIILLFIVSAVVVFIIKRSK